MQIRAIIATSFADIFRSNCFNNGMLPIALPRDQVWGVCVVGVWCVCGVRVVCGVCGVCVVCVCGVWCVWCGTCVRACVRGVMRDTALVRLGALCCVACMRRCACRPVECTY